MTYQSSAAVAAEPRAPPSHVRPYRAPELAIIVPTLNEAGNVEELVRRLRAALHGIAWEVVFVDDDSHDGTTEILLAVQQHEAEVRSLRRIGRRGLASACIEGIQATAAPFVAVMDADLQHDERVLPRMLEMLKAENLDVVVATRFAAGAGTDNLAPHRRHLSRLGAALSRVISRAELSDPMSGFFMLRRSFFDRVARRLSGQGFKILLDLFASAPGRVRFAELPFRFRERHHGQSKLDIPVMLEYIILIGDKLFGRYLPVRFVIFVLVGLFGVLVHLFFLALCYKWIEMSFVLSQVVATASAMTFNFNLNNLLTYRDRRLRGASLIYGHISFYLICSIGAVANVQIAELLHDYQVPWALAGTLGAGVGAVWNYGVSSTFTWRKPA